MSIFWAIGGFLVVLTPIILIHELGHFTAAKLSNIKVEEFGFGLPPRAWTIAKRKGTIYSLNWIPLGGFVRPAGEDDPTVEGGLAGASKRARFFVLIAGSAANMIAALLIFWIAMMFGPPAIAIGDVNPGSPAEAAGLMAGDVLHTINGDLVDNTNILLETVYEFAGREVELVVLRDGDEFPIITVPREPGEYDAQTEGPIGVSLVMAPNGVRVGRGPIAAAGAATELFSEYIRLYIRLPAMLISGEIAPQDARPLSVVGISQVAGAAAESSATTGSLYPILTMAAFISVALAITNLLPIPALDGGRIMFVLIEAIRGRRIEPEREGMVHVIGMLVLLGLMVLMIVQDIINPVIPLQ